MPWKALKTSAGSGWKEIDRAAGTGWKELSWDVVNIDVGRTAVDSSHLLGENNTLLTLTNPCNANGSVDKFDVYVGSLGNGTLRVGIVYLVSGSIYKCRDAENVNVIAGLNSNIAVNLTVVAGDYIAIYCGTGDARPDIEFGLHTGKNYAGNGLIVDSQFTYSTDHYNLAAYASNY